VTLDLEAAYPASEDPEDVAATREFDGKRNRWFLDPVLRGAYPADVLERFAPNAPPICDGDMAVIAAPIDFLGVNYYQRRVVGRSADGGWRGVHQDGSVYTDMGWEVSPEGLFDLMLRLRDDHATRDHRRRTAPHSVTFGATTVVRDPERREYIASHVEAMHRAIAAGVPVEGYFAWTLMDNFEWAFGYAKRFGLVYVDFPTLERVPKSSFYWYRDHIARVTSGGVTR
jgi:beta-glucosidase